MRLNPYERRAIEQAARETFPAGTAVYLFGSRVDDQRRGGDIDVLVETPAPWSARETTERATRFTARLYRLLDERRVDVIAATRGVADPRPIVAATRQGGIPPVCT